jgi:hypothetical protein
VATEATEKLWVKGSSSNPVYVGGVSGSPVYVGTEATEKLWVKGTSSNPVYVGGVSGSPVYVGTEATEKLWVKGTSSNPVYVGGVSGSPVNVATEATEKLWVKGTSSNPVYVGGVSGSPVYVATEATEKLWVKGTSSDPVYIEGLENEALPTMSSEHHSIHESKHFYIGDYIELGSGSTMSWYFTTPNTTTWTHMTFEVDAQALVTVDFYEGGTYGGGGTASTALSPAQVLNNNRNSNATTSLTIFRNGTASALGSKILGVKLGAATTPTNRAAGALDRSEEIILRQNTTYILVITSGAATNTVTYHAKWYEEVMP